MPEKRVFLPPRLDCHGSPKPGERVFASTYDEILTYAKQILNLMNMVVG